jgi:ribosome maturation factor RimP
MTAREEQEKVRARLAEITTPIAEGMGLELVDVVYQREPGGWVVRIMLDRVGNKGGPGEGVTLEDCTRVSRSLSAILDEENVIEASYHLEVSSPGITRPLTRPGDFERFAGRMARVKLREPVCGRKSYVGRLAGVAPHTPGSEPVTVVLETEGGRVELPFEQVSRANLEYEND